MRKVNVAVLNAATILAVCSASGSAVADQASVLSETLKYYVTVEPGMARYSTVFSDLNGDGRDEAIVYISGPGYCLRGGCKALILRPRGNGYTLIMRTSVARLPIRLLPTSSNGWQDISFTLGTEGSTVGDVMLRFDGLRYSAAPAQPTVRTAGTVLIPANEKGGLFPQNVASNRVVQPPSLTATSGGNAPP
jgi:hypothetical protein